MSDLRRIWWWPPLPAQARVFEIGYGAGHFLRACRARGWRAEACDPAGSRDVPAVCYLERAEAWLWPTVPTYHAVFAWQVLEHLEDPGKVLALAHRALRADGYLVVSVPNTRSIERWVMGRAWDGWSPGYHRWFWNAAELTALMEEAGFRVERVLYQRQVKHLPGPAWMNFLVGTVLAAVGLTGRMTLVARPA